MPREPRKRPPVLAHQRFVERAQELSGLGSEALFAEIWRSNLWGADQSRSGLGSEEAATSHLVASLPDLFRQFGIRMLLDLPCGDFNWMQTVVHDLDRYIGADIVSDLVAQNAAIHSNADGRISFRKLNLLNDELPSVDAILCRDCLVHLSFANIRKALRNIRRSGISWLIATTFTDHVLNIDAVDGDWRLLNMERPPIGLSSAAAILNERCQEAGGAYGDKSLGVWKIADFPPF